MTTLLVDCYRRDSEKKMPHYERLCRLHSSEVVTVTPERLGSCCDLDGVAAVVISGSQVMLSEEAPDPVLAEFAGRLCVPTLGICFGHQLLARVAGAKVARGEVIERSETITVLEPHLLFEGLAPETVMLESHREYVVLETIERAGWHVFARSGSCLVEAMHHPLRPLYGVQFHPERSGLPGERLFENFYRNIVARFSRDGSRAAACD